MSSPPPPAWPAAAPSSPARPPPRGRRPRPCASAARATGLGGLVHASLDRGAEWARVEARDVARPEFRIYSGHERALDMVGYGSDYLLATAGCAPEAFAARDRAWRAGAAIGFTLNDTLQALAALL